MINFRTLQAKELEEVLYEELLKRGQLNFNDLIEIHDRKTEYHLRRVSGGAIGMLRERDNVIQTTDENGRMLFKLI